MTPVALVPLLLASLVATPAAHVASPKTAPARVIYRAAARALAPEPVKTRRAPSIATGPNVIRKSDTHRERDLALSRRLAKSGTYVIDGITEREPGEFVAVTMNIHLGGIPGDQSGDPVNENVNALLDDARHINSGNPDVVLVQEMRSRPAIKGRPGIAETPSLFAELIGADDMAFTPAFERDPNVHNEQQYGTAFYTRNGHKLTRVVNAALANPGSENEPRSFGVAEVIAPNGERSTFLWTHLHTFLNENYDPKLAQAGAALRKLQLADIAEVVKSLQQTGSFTYRDTLTGQMRTATGFSKDVRLVGGDFNQTKAPSDGVMNQVGLTHVNDLLRRSTGRAPKGETFNGEVFTAWDSGMKGTPHFVDQLYAPTQSSKYAVKEVAVGEIARHHHAGPSTDHKPVWLKLVRRP
jgi:endonuclease/exonuclease/phosphatase family metal-dependent hydrolase